MSKTQNLVDAVKAGSLKIESNGYVYRRAIADHAFSGIKAGIWYTLKNGQPVEVTQ